MLYEVIEDPVVNKWITANYMQNASTLGDVSLSSDGL